MARVRQVQIPSIGDELVLAEDWTFTVTAEHRNDKLIDHLRKTEAIPFDAPTYVPVVRCGRDVVIPGRPERRFPGSGWPGSGYTTPAVPERTEQCQNVAGHEGACNPRHWLRPVFARYACTASAGTRLRVDRIYIRKGAKDFDSVTFWAAGLGAKKVRFWAKLADVNNMRVEVGPRPRPRKVAPLPLRAIRVREEALDGQPLPDAALV